jgi:hypothetical protein
MFRNVFEIQTMPIYLCPLQAIKAKMVLEGLEPGLLE